MQSLCPIPINPLIKPKAMAELISDCSSGVLFDEKCCNSDRVDNGAENDSIIPVVVVLVLLVVNPMVMGKGVKL